VNIRLYSISVPQLVLKLFNIFGSIKVGWKSNYRKRFFLSDLKPDKVGLKAGLCEMILRG
jgi:hypothetical protein